MPLGAIWRRAQTSLPDTNTAPHVDPRSSSPIRTRHAAQRENCRGSSGAKSASTFSAVVHYLRSGAIPGLFSQIGTTATSVAIDRNRRKRLPFP
jgi:hypothetical protein